jgi:hypothetical protein
MEADPTQSKQDVSTKHGGSGDDSSAAKHAPTSAATSGSAAHPVAASVDAGPVASDAGAAPAVKHTFACGSSTCDLSSTFCCVGLFGDAECDAPGHSNFGCAAEIHCQGPADCPGGQKCCALAGTASCQSECGIGSLTVCDPAANTCGSDAPNCRPDPFNPAVNLSACFP